MPRYTYRALQADGEIQTGAIAAASRDAANMQLRAGGLVPIEVTPKRAFLGLAAAKDRDAGRAPTLRDLSVFTREIGMLLGAGVTLDRSLRMLVDQGEGPMSRLAGTLLTDISRGASLSEALAKHPTIFPPFYLGMARAGEAGGHMAGAFRRLHEMLQKQAALNARVRSALTYPVIILVLTGVSVAILLALVVPQFKPVFAQAGDDLPFATQVIVAASDFALDYGLFALAALLAAGLMVWRLRLPAALRLRRDALLLRLPAVGPLIRALEAGRFCRMLGALRANGVDLVAAVGIAGETMNNAAMRAGVDHLAGPLTHGEGLAAPLEALRIFPPLAGELIAVGEESGKLDDMLIETANMLDDETDRKIQSALALLVPLVTVLLGVIVAGVIGAILSAILGTYRIGL